MHRTTEFTELAEATRAAFEEAFDAATRLKQYAAAGNRKAATEWGQFMVDTMEAAAAGAPALDRAVIADWLGEVQARFA